MFRSLVSALIERPDLRNEASAGVKTCAAKFEWARLAGGLGDWYTKVGA